MQVMTRQAKLDDIPYLRRIWKTVFATSDEELFFSYFFAPENCIISESGGIPTAMGCLLDVGNFIAQGKPCPCAMIYALSTLPEHRGNGFASAIVERLVAYGNDLGYQAIILCPSDDSLFEYYTRLNFHDIFYVSEKVYEGFSNLNCEATISKLDSEDYMILRKSLLDDITHIELNHRAIEYQRQLCAFTGGEFIQIESHGTISCAAFEKANDGVVLLKELLVPDGVGLEENVLAAIGCHIPSHKYIVRTPVHAHQDSNIRRFGMISASDQLLNTAGIYPWYGFAYD